MKNMLSGAVQAFQDYSKRTGFTTNQLARRSEQRADPTLLAATLADVRATAFLFVGAEIMLDPAAADPALFDLARARSLGAALDEAVLLGWTAEEAPRLAAMLPTFPPQESLQLVDLRRLAGEGLLSDRIMGEVAQARSLLGWHSRHGYCANCGRPTAAALAGYRRDCAHCGSQHFPRTDPVVIMLISDGDQALLGRRASFQPGHYSCLAGFVEPGETVEDAVRRETFEESGIRVGMVSYHASQPWPFVSSLMIGCLGAAISREIAIDREELEDCRWFEREELARMAAGTHPDGFSVSPPHAIARRLIDHWLTCD